jgi:hypothetical protein
MTQKVITVVAAPESGKGHVQEVDFPEITKALEEGYTVKEIKQVQMPAAFSGTWFVLTFILEKSELKQRTAAY